MDLSLPPSSTLVRLEGMKRVSLLPNPVAPCFLEKPQSWVPFSQTSFPLQNPPLDIKVSESVCFLYFTCKCQDVCFEFHGKGGYHLWLSCICLLPQFKEQVQQGGPVTSSLTVPSTPPAPGPWAAVKGRCMGGCVGCATLPWVDLHPEVVWWKILVVNFTC